MSFDDFMNSLSKTNTTLESLVDFEKVKLQVNKISMHLCALNYLLGKPDLKSAVSELYSVNKSCFSVLGILLATRNGKKIIKDDGSVINIEQFLSSESEILLFIEKSGLKEVFTTSSINNLVDYVFGVEVGLDTNARKNRGGDIMSSVVSSVFRQSNISFSKEVASTCFPNLGLGADTKVFDFVIYTKKITYLIEVNYYNGGGSKLNETARSYTEIGPKINGTPDFEFVWITDGQGWVSAKKMLEEAYNVIPKVYNLSTLHKFVEEIKHNNA